MDVSNWSTSRAILGMFKSMIFVSTRLDVWRLQGLRLMMLYLWLTPHHIVHAVTMCVKMGHRASSKIGC